MSDPTLEWALAAAEAASQSDRDLVDLAECLHSLCDELGQALAPLGLSSLQGSLEVVRRSAAEALLRAHQRQAKMKTQQALIEVRHLSR